MRAYCFREAGAEQLAQLLDGLDAVDDADLLGVDSMAQEIAAAAQRVLVDQNPPGLKKRAARRAKEPQGTGALPAVWEPERTPPRSPAGEARAARAEPPQKQSLPSLDNAPVLVLPTEFEIRDELQRLVVSDLLGPVGGPSEILDGKTSPTDRYLVGKLAPRKQRVEIRAEGDLAVAGDDGDEDQDIDQDVPLPDTMFPSSMGMTFTVDASAGALRVLASWARYERRDRDDPAAGGAESSKVWQRVQHQASFPSLQLQVGELNESRSDTDRDVLLTWRISRFAEHFIVTLFLVNATDEPKSNKAQAWLFQPELTAESADGSPIFTRRTTGAESTEASGDTPTDEAILAMLYRRKAEFAVGHGVATHADVDPSEPYRAMRIRARVVPTYDVPQTQMPTEAEAPWMSGLALDMTALATLPRDRLFSSLKTLPQAYGEWIANQSRRAEEEDDLKDHSEAAAQALANCRRAQERIQAGIDVLATDELALEAFRFANQAMALQRVHTIYAQAVRRGQNADLSAIDIPGNRSWYMFQLAFLLLNLPSLSDPQHPDRAAGANATADLLWFPTGGGKTEAYLGLTAFTLAIRRLQRTISGHSGSYGVGVLMRYTLRLLTLQQFQRATSLICACEVIRRQAATEGDNRWGPEMFRLGLWVGQAATPNRTKDAEEAVRQARGGAWVHGGGRSLGSPAQIKSCPWCGAPIDEGKDIIVEPFPGGRGRTIIYCGDKLGACPFGRKQSPGEGLPALVVDEEIYRLLPGLLIGTVDKFAQMPWRGEVEMLFGQVHRRCERHGFRSPDLEDSDSHPQSSLFPRAVTIDCDPARPPDLIIQDELHLISGPLGTLVGLYETAIDSLCTWTVGGQEVRPKVIASTATVRRADVQIHGLFLRGVEIFPSPGLDIEDNFFSRQRTPTPEHPGRRYLGICATGTRLKAALIRAYVAYMAGAQYLYATQGYGRAADPWMTLVGYFTSLRELGGMRRLVDDDVRNRLAQADTAGLAKRTPRVVEELTSRKASIDIPRILDLMEIGFDGQAETGGDNGRKRGSRPIDVLLATNMISVGVDVNRLGLMVVAGQPKTTAEYIQATSRVGRQHPGLVCTVFNWARPRDLSHYERFEHYHATFYQQVEPLSVTPFAARALDRALSALLVSMVRLDDDKYNANLGAGLVAEGDPLFGEIVRKVSDRAEAVTGRADVSVAVGADIERRLALWRAEAGRNEGGRQLGYKPSRDLVTLGLLSAPGAEPWADFTCPTSLRDVEPSVNLILTPGELDEDR
jgi:Helicase conserved C-terminal domain